ncbi:hypothetical protein C4D60_Mb04t33670 [Musa balbisiana]|uniref:Uncharacterized protein n=1 Tax=Musa balbisiana TaxID=52838 RepID=A0A4S8KGJ7_MUSBA|nr:hypothetical protein C4D60_Mb04t33670 [Musa balbisiana]
MGYVNSESNRTEQGSGHFSKPRAENSILDHFAPFGPPPPPSPSRLSSRRFKCSSAATIGRWIFIDSSWDGSLRVFASEVCLVGRPGTPIRLVKVVSFVYHFVLVSLMLVMVLPLSAGLSFFQSWRLDDYS